MKKPYEPLSGWDEDGLFPGVSGEGRKKGRQSGRTHFLAVITLMFSLTVFFLVDGSDRTEGIAWGMGENGGLPASGFVVVDMSDLLSEDWTAGGELAEEDLLAHVNTPPVADDILSAWRYPAQERSFGWHWPDRVVVSAGSAGVPAVQYDDSGSSRLDGFRVVVPSQLPGVNVFSTVPGAPVSSVEELRFSSFVSALPLPERFAEEKAEDAPSPLVANQGNLPANKSATSYGSVVLSVFDSGRSLPDQNDGETSQEDDIVLTETTPRWREHVVKAGQTLSDIAVLYSISVVDIMKANELKNANKLAQQQLLLIPNGSGDVDATLEEVLTRKGRVLAAKEQVTPVQVKQYTVVKGDSLWSIASAENLEIDTLYGSNNLKNPDMLKPGMTLRIPDQDGMFYVIKNGDTLEKIARRFGITVVAIRKGNDPKATATLAKGAELFLPGARPEAENAAKTSSNSGGTRGGSALTPAASRSYRWPVVGKINSPFGWRRHPVTRRRDFHTGIDIKAPRGRPIKAARSGQVEYSGWMGGYGRVVVIKHGDGNSTLYAHCNALSVRKGQKVTQGQQIGTVGTSGRTTGPHLHFEVRQGKGPVNPLKLLR